MSFSRSSNVMRRFSRSARSSARRAAFCELSLVFFPARSCASSSNARASQWLISFVSRVRTSRSTFSISGRRRAFTSATCARPSSAVANSMAVRSSSPRSHVPVEPSSRSAASPGRAGRRLRWGAIPASATLPSLPMAANWSFSETMCGLPVAVVRPSRTPCSRSTTADGSSPQSVSSTSTAPCRVRWPYLSRTMPMTASRSGCPGWMKAAMGCRWTRPFSKQALLDPVRVPGQVVVDHQVAALEVHALARGVVGDEHQQAAVGHEPLDHLAPLLAPDAAVDGGDRIRTPQAGPDLAQQIVEGVLRLGEDDELAAVTVRVDHPVVVEDPVEPGPLRIPARVQHAERLPLQRIEGLDLQPELLDGLGRGRAGDDPIFDLVDLLLAVLVDRLHDLLGHRRRPEAGLQALGGKLRLGKLAFEPLAAPPERAVDRGRGGREPALQDLQCEADVVPSLAVALRKAPDAVHLGAHVVGNGSVEGGRPLKVTPLMSKRSDGPSAALRTIARQGRYHRSSRKRHCPVPPTRSGRKAPQIGAPLI